MNSSKPYQGLFADDTKEQAIWHGLPNGKHALGILHYVDPEQEKQQSQVDTSGETTYWPKHHWPSISISTVYAVVYDAVNVWFENVSIDKAAYQRVIWQWYPSHLKVIWQASDIQIQFIAAMQDGDTGRVDVTVTNVGKSDVSGTLIVQGDNDKTNCNAKGQTWIRQESSYTRDDAGCTTIDKHLQWGITHEFFPYFANLKPADQQFNWTSMYYRLQFQVTEDDWQQQDGHTWAQQRDLTLKPGEQHNFSVNFAGEWFGKSEHAPARSFPAVAAGLAEKNQQLWAQRFDHIPAPKGDWPQPILNLYYKAWTSVLYNTIPAADMIFFDSKLPIGVCCKQGTSTMTCCPATWESALIALCVSLIDPKWSCDLIEAIYQPIHDDGYIGELPGSIRHSQLPAVEPFVIWCCYKASNDKAFLERVYDRMLLNLQYKAHHPTWMHHAPFMSRNYAYVNISAKFGLRIAQTLGKPEKDIALFEQMIDHSRRAINSYWDDEGQFYRANFVPALGRGFGHGQHEEGTDAEALLPLISEEDPARRARLIEVIRDEFLTDTNVIARKPKTLPRAMSGTYGSAGNHADFSLKESNMMFLLKAIKDEDRDLFTRIANGTLSNIRTDGDFYECYTFDGQGRHNGPGSIFGAFAVIWSVLLQEDQVDHLYD